MHDRRERELVLAPNEYAYVLDTTKGHINCYVGPNKTSLAQTDQTVIFNSRTKRFEYVDLDNAVLLFATAPTNWYMVLKNPARANEHPKSGIASSLMELEVGRKVIQPGPCTFPLWPGQMVKIIAGHRIQSNEYLYIQVYDAEEASQQWRAVLGLPAQPKEGEDVQEPTFVVGEKRIIKGTDVKFYIPPTGVEVISDQEGRYVRKAVPLRRLEYCVLIGEDGRYQYLRGEAVVFPEPNQSFLERGGKCKFEAIELSDTSGLYIKVIAPYTDEDGTEHQEGEELFITGDSVIYFPREEHAIIRLGGDELHQSVAIPKGEGRYVLDRRTGEVRLQRGPLMFLPDPRKVVLTRRVLSDRECGLLYPGNEEALAFNRLLRQSAQMGMSPEDMAKALTQEKPEEPKGGRRERRGRRSGSGASEVKRSTEFKKPRTITLATAYEGAVRVDVWAGYAVQVVDRSGNRRVDVGPTTILLEYDEMLHPLSLSTGTPKSSDKLLHTVFLQTNGNKVSDVIEFQSHDLVKARLRLTYRVSFTGDDPGAWFSVDNYVKLLCDHASSMIKARLRRVPIRALQSEITPIVRDLILGTKSEEGGSRPGLSFSENGMRVYDVEVLGLEVADAAVRDMLISSQTDAVRKAIEVVTRETDLHQQKRLQEIERSLSREHHETKLLRMSLEAERAGRSHDEAVETHNRKAGLKELDGQLRRVVAALEAELVAQALEQRKAAHAVNLQEKQELQAVDLQALEARVQGAVAASQAFSPQLVYALRQLGDQQLLTALSDNFGELAAVEGRGLLETARKFLDFVPTTLVPSLHADPSSSDEG